MTIETIDCPHCQEEIDIRDVVSAQISTALKLKMAELEHSYKAKDSSLAERESTLEHRLSDIEAEVNREVQDRLQQQRHDIESQLRQDHAAVQEATEKQVIELRKANSELRVIAAENEALKRDAAEADERARLQAQKDLSNDRQRYLEEALDRAEEKYAPQIAELQHQLNQTGKLLKDAERKTAQGSQQLQGEAAELHIEETLRESFENDTVMEVPKGIRGADCELLVHGKTLKPAGSILIESKATQAFRKDYVEKLKNDLAESDATVAVLITKTLPAGEKLFIQDGPITVVQTSYSLMCIALIREKIIAISRLQAVDSYKESMAEQLYNLLTSEEFVLRLHYCCHLYSQAREERKRSRRQVQRSWAKEDKIFSRLEKFLIESVGEVQPLMPTNILQLIDPEEEEQKLLIESEVRH